MSTARGESVVELSQEMLAIAAEVQRRRSVQSGKGLVPDFDTTVVEVAFLDLYHREVAVGDLRNTWRLDVLPIDLDGNEVRVVSRQWPMLVFAQQLSADAFVFAAKKSKTIVEFYGWLPTPLIERLPVRWLDRDGERVSYSHEVERDYLFPMPGEFRFTDGCKHDDWPAWWEYTIGGWFCFGCQRVIVDARDRERIAKQDAELGFASASGAFTTGT